MKFIRIIKKIWNDNVIGSVISCIIYSTIVSLVGLLSSNIPFVKNFFLNTITFYYFIFFILAFFILILFIVLIKRNRLILSNYKRQIEKLLNEITQLNRELNELKKEPENPRLSLFTNGDVVIIKGSNAYLYAVEYTVVGRTKDSIIIVDNQGKRKTVSPDALLTEKEYREEIEKQKLEYDKLIFQKRKSYNPFSSL